MGAADCLGRMEIFLCSFSASGFTHVASSPGPFETKTTVSEAFFLAVVGNEAN